MSSNLQKNKRRIDRLKKNQYRRQEAKRDLYWKSTDIVFSEAVEKLRMSLMGCRVPGCLELAVLWDEVFLQQNDMVLVVPVCRDHWDAADKHSPCSCGECDDPDISDLETDVNVVIDRIGRALILEKISVGIPMKDDWANVEVLDYATLDTLRAELIQEGS